MQYIDEPNETCARVSGFIVVFVPYGLPPSDLFIYFFFFLVRFHLLWQRGQSEYECSRGGCAMYEIQQPKNVVRHATATVHFLFAMSAWEKISFFVRSTSICLSSLLMYCTFTIINNLLSSLQNKFPFFFSFCEFMLMDLHTDMRHVRPAMLQILHYSSSSILHYYHDLTVALLIFAFHNFHFFTTFDSWLSCERPYRFLTILAVRLNAWTRHAAAIMEKAKNQHQKTSDDVQNAFSALMDWWLSRNWKPKWGDQTPSRIKVYATALRTTTKYFY